MTCMLFFKQTSYFWQVGLKINTNVQLCTLYRFQSHLHTHTHTQQWQQPGLDTLEEAADKQRFFGELEGDRSSPVDYSELNRQLGDTGVSSLTLGYVETLTLVTALPSLSSSPPLFPLSLLSLCLFLSPFTYFSLLSLSSSSLSSSTSFLSLTSSFQQHDSTIFVLLCNLAQFNISSFELVYMPPRFLSQVES